MMRTVQSRSGVLRTQHALTEGEIDTLVSKCRPEDRWAFEGMLRGERTLDGDLISPSLTEDAS